jgi:ribonuclease HI
MAKKYYVVWAGRETGVFTDWAYTKALVDKFPQAKYKSFPSQQAAQEAFNAGHGAASNNPSPSKPVKAKTVTQPVPTTSQAQVIIYCDGACDPNPGEAGSGVAVYEKDQLQQLWYGLYNPQGTNNTAELNALYQSLLIAQQNIKANKTVQILCDSQYAINCITNWAFSWKKSGWKKKTGEIKNLEIIQLAHELFISLDEGLQVNHVKAHAGIEGNELADRMAMFGAQQKASDFCLYQAPLDIEYILSFERG